MEEVPVLIKDLALILVVASAVTLLFKRLTQPLVLGYIVAGFLVSPHMPYIMSVIDKADIKVWADIGVIFLLFSLGLDFSFKKIIKMGMAPIIAACTIVFCMIMLGVSIGNLFGWGQMDCVFLGGMLAMSSTTIIYKAFDDMGLRQHKFAGLVMSVLILEDILAIVMMVMLGAMAGADSGGGDMLWSVAKIAFFLILWFVIGIFALPAILRRSRKIINDEILLVISVGLCCMMAIVSASAGFSSAFGAFVMGSILAETIEAEKIIRLVEPVKNLFGAIFFVSVGMLVDPKILIDYALPISALVATILVGQALFGSLGYLISGQTLKTAMRCGFSMAQIGEFAFIIASMGLSMGVVGDFLYPVVVAVSVITTFLTPYMIRFADPCYNTMEKHLPKKFIAILNNITLSPPATSQSKGTWHTLLMAMLRITVVYSILSTAVIALMFTFVLPVTRQLLPGWELHWVANAITGAFTVLLISPFLRAIVWKKNRSEEFRHLWAESRFNRLPLIFTFLVRLAVACGFLFYICNYLSRFSNALMITIAVALLAIMISSRKLKRSSIRLERLFVQNLRSRDIEAQVRGTKRPLYAGRLLDRDLHISDIDIPMNSKWAGKTLKQLNLGSTYHIHISSILRADRRLNIPTGDSIIFPGDRLQVIGNDEQLSAFAHSAANNTFDSDPEIEKREMQLRQLAIHGGSPLLGKTLMDSMIRDKYNCLVVGIEEGAETLSEVSPDYVFCKGDIIWIVGEAESIATLANL